MNRPSGAATPLRARRPLVDDRCRHCRGADKLIAEQQRANESAIRLIREQREKIDQLEYLLALRGRLVWFPREDETPKQDGLIVPRVFDMEARVLA